MKKIQRTVSVKLDITQDQTDLFFTVSSLYNEAYKDIVNYCNKEQTVNRTHLQSNMYYALRKKYPQLPSQFISIVLRDASGNVKSFNSNNPKKRWTLNVNKRSLTLPYDLRIMSLRGSLLRLSTLQGSQRQSFLIKIPEWFENKYKANLKAAKLTIKSSSIKLIFDVEKPKSTTKSKIVGVDRGIKNIVATSEGELISSSHVRSLKRKFHYNRKTLQEKGTKSSKRRLKSMNGKEKRFVSNVNHVISKKLANDEVAVYVLENLKGITNKRKGKLLNKYLHNWSYYQLEQYLTYKCEYNDISIVYVDPHYTSQMCNRCLKVDKRNRNGNSFKCIFCNHKDHSDLNAAKNIKDKYLLKDKQTGCNQPSICLTN